MDVIQAIEQRRAFRSLAPASIEDSQMEDLARCAALAPSCFNKQPWRFVFAKGADQISHLAQAMKSGNEWTARASLIIAVCTKKDLDCVMKDGREYALFDTGLASAFLILRATEMGLVAHPIAGYDPATVRQVLSIPDDLQVIVLIIVGKKAEAIDPELPEWAKESERKRPERLPIEDFLFRERYSAPKGK